MAKLFTELLPDIPDLVKLGTAEAATWPFLLDSSESGPLGQYSILLHADEQVLCLDQKGNLSGPGSGDSFLERFNSWYKELATPVQSSSLPFVGGWFTYLSYELAGEIEPILELPPDSGGLPVALAVRCKAAIIVQHGASSTATLVAESPELGESLLKDLSELACSEDDCEAVVSNVKADPAGDFESSVGRIHEYLLDGDIFQVNLSRGWRCEFDRPVSAHRLYTSLRKANPAPFAGMMHWQDKVLMSSSPERLVEVRGREVQTRPIAGTHPRDTDSIADEVLSQRLLEHPKERAEHIMLIDLERNDLGRVCEPGSVEVNELMVLESYAHVHHIVSNVRGKLEQGVTPIEVLAAVFPGGTITGCPKVRCMQIIAELEAKGRGFYTGSMGYIDRSGNMDTNILIRSMQLDGKQLDFRTGAGIVIDSEPSLEVMETEHKARGLLAAIGRETQSHRELKHD